MSTSSVAVGKIEMQLRKGQALPSKGWALGRDLYIAIKATPSSWHSF